VYSLFFLLLLSLRSGPWWTVQTSGIDSNLRGVSVTSRQDSQGKKHDVIWASGSNGVILLSTDDGNDWKQLTVTGGESLDFRDIEAFDADTAYLMSSGDGDKSRIYKTTDGGKSWTLQYSDKRAGFFLDSLACDSKMHCVALSDPVDGKFLVLATVDGGQWKELPRDKMLAILPGEGAFAAGGRAIALCGKNKIYFGTGGGRSPRVFRSRDQGFSWTAMEIPITGGSASSGIFGISCGENGTVIAVGGDYKEPDAAKLVAAHSEDSGATWHLAQQQPGGYRSAVAEFSVNGYVAVGTDGTDVSHDRGIHWEHTDQLNLNALSFLGDSGWAVGPKGTIARFKNR
jgi:photosystem II stability/assembly factor-like uncharacterized protein